MRTTNYYDTFIAVAEDCPVDAAQVPPVRSNARSVATIQYEMLAREPYVHTSDDVLFAVHAERTGISPVDHEEARRAFFAIPQPCLRSSPLTKRYGWGIHSDAEGRIALVPMGGDEYRRLHGDPSVRQLKALRSKRT